jgi:hypothetical protein
MTTNDTSMSLAEIDRRIDLNKKSGWGLERGTQAQLNLLALYCQKHRLLPGDDVTLYEGKPWITIDGRVKLMRRNKDYRGFTLRPLKPEEKQEWSYDPDDIVIEALIYVDGFPKPIQGHGRVSKAERTGQGAGRLNPVAKTNPVEMANKRALARAERLAFGTESYVDDEELDEAVRTVIEERNDPVARAAGAAKYVEIFGKDDDDHAPKVDTETGEVLEVETERDAAIRAWVDASEEATRLGIKHNQPPHEASPELIKKGTDVLTAKILKAQEAAAVR